MDLGLLISLSVYLCETNTLHQQNLILLGKEKCLLAQLFGESKKKQ